MPSTRTTRTKRIPSNPKRTNNKPKLLPVTNSYCLQDEPKCDWSLSRNSNYGVSLLLLWQVLELLGNIEKEQHRWLQCSAFLGFLLKTQKSTVGFWSCVPKQTNHLIRSPTGCKAPTIIPWGPARLSNGIHPRFQCPDLSSWLWQNVPMERFL